MNIHPVFEDCCAKNNTAVAKYRADIPWIKDGHLYATNGYLAVRTPIQLPDSIGEFPPASTLDWNATCYSDSPIEITDPGPPLVSEKCDRCKGKGVIEKLNCESCDGTGVAQCDLGHEHECEDCFGDGNANEPGTCQVCDGTGFEKQKFFGIFVGGDIHIKDDVARLLYKYKAKLYLNNKMASSSPLRFVIDGGIEGIAMPYMPPQGKQTRAAASSAS